MLEAVDVRSGYGTFEVLHDVSLDVGANEIVALLGHNGAGKTTLLRAMYGALPRWTGVRQMSQRGFERTQVGQ